jgi:hypothetical protein
MRVPITSRTQTHKLAIRRTLRVRGVSDASSAGMAARSDLMRRRFIERTRAAKARRVPSSRCLDLQRCRARDRGAPVHRDICTRAPGATVFSFDVRRQMLDAGDDRGSDDRRVPLRIRQA